MLLDIQGNPESFAAYLEEYGNTICGRHPIGILLNVGHPLFTHASHALQHLLHCCLLQCPSPLVSGVLLQMMKHTHLEHTISFKKYDQSSQCQSTQDSSVSYAAAIVTIV